MRACELSCKCPYTCSADLSSNLVVLHRFIVSILAVILLSLSVVLAEEVSKIASTYSDDLELQWIGYALFDLDFLY